MQDKNDRVEERCERAGVLVVVCVNPFIWAGPGKCLTSFTDNRALAINHYKRDSLGKGKS